MYLQLREDIESPKKYSVFNKIEVYFLSTEIWVGGLGL